MKFINSVISVLLISAGVRRRHPQRLFCQPDAQCKIERRLGTESDSAGHSDDTEKSANAQCRTAAALPHGWHATRHKRENPRWGNPRGFCLSGRDRASENDDGRKRLSSGAH
jgi:hypothetical protein